MNTGGVSQKISKEYVYPTLSYQIIGCLYDVHNSLGGGHKELYYQRAVAKALTAKEISFVEQYYVPLKFQGEIVGKYYLDFLIEDKIVLELKRGRYTSIGVINQTKEYLQVLDKKLGIIACFATDAVVIKRILNLY